jgi:hypothetical protein
MTAFGRIVAVLTTLAALVTAVEVLVRIARAAWRLVTGLLKGSRLVAGFGRFRLAGVTR